MVSSSGSESTLGSEVYEHNNEYQAIDVIGQDWSSVVVATLTRGLGASSLPRNEGCMLGQLRVAGFSLFTVFTVLGRFSRRRVGGSGALKGKCHSKWKPFSLRGRAVTGRRGTW